jgi:S-(hydroxymethyl)glutathione dehydrogenase/alcohol dehydrogenase
MRGIVFTGEKAEVSDALEVRAPGPKEVSVSVVAAGVCHSDLSVINGTIPFPPPVVLGHEGAGIVEAVGSEVTSVKPGDHVVIATLASCGVCRACATGHPTWCRKSLGNISTPFTYEGKPAYNFAAASVFAERTVVQEVQAVRIPADVPFTSACLIACGVLTGVGAVLNRARVRPGETAAVFGVGGVGLNVIQGLRLSGATRIVAVDTVADKESLGRQFGATDFVDASDGDAAAAVRALVPPDRERASGALGPAGGVTWAFDCVGHPAVLRSALDCLDWGGTAVALGIPPRGTEVAVDVNELAYVDRSLMGCRYGSSRPHHDIPLMIDLYRAGTLLLDELVTLTRPLDQFSEVVDEMHAGRVARGVLVLDPAMAAQA